MLAPLAEEPCRTESSDEGSSASALLQRSSESLSTPRVQLYSAGGDGALGWVAGWGGQRVSRMRCYQACARPLAIIPRPVR